MAVRLHHPPTFSRRVASGGWGATSALWARAAPRRVDVLGSGCGVGGAVRDRPARVLRLQIEPRAALARELVQEVKPRASPSDGSMASPRERLRVLHEHRAHDERDARHAATRARLRDHPARRRTPCRSKKSLPRRQAISRTIHGLRTLRHDGDIDCDVRPERVAAAEHAQAQSACSGGTGRRRVEVGRVVPGASAVAHHAIDRAPTRPTRPSQRSRWAVPPCGCPGGRHAPAMGARCWASRDS